MSKIHFKRLTRIKNSKASAIIAIVGFIVLIASATPMSILANYGAYQHGVAEARQAYLQECIDNKMQDYLNLYFDGGIQGLKMGHLEDRSNFYLVILSENGNTLYYGGNPSDAQASGFMTHEIELCGEQETVSRVFGNDEARMKWIENLGVNNEIYDVETWETPDLTDSSTTDDSEQENIEYHADVTYAEREVTKLTFCGYIRNTFICDDSITEGLNRLDIMLKMRMLFPIMVVFGAAVTIYFGAGWIAGSASALFSGFRTAGKKVKERLPFKNRSKQSVGFLRTAGTQVYSAWRKFLRPMLLRMPLVLPALFIFIICSIFEILLIDSYTFDFLWIGIKVLELIGISYVMLCLQYLRRRGEELADGSLSPVDKPFLPLAGPFLDHDENLNHGWKVIQNAVNEQMKAERMRTELITNVSHDIKTPLTSIINYVDLMGKEDLPEGNPKIYLEVLERQSARLKKLTEDLVEASRAATGSITVQLQDTNLNVLLEQSVGEYETRLQSRGLRSILTLPERAPVIHADGKLLWRVFDNLLGNIVKYAQPGTRVYISCTVGEKVEITFRNISADELNISADELLERFVRGDRSRNTEGSGLGLSIAQSLTELQGGEFNLQVDGDLFKATISFPLPKAD